MTDESLLAGDNAGPENPEVIEAPKAEGTEEAEKKPEAEKPKRNGFSRKISKLEAEIAELRATRTQETPKKSNDDGAPKEEDYQDKSWGEYYRDLAKYEAKQLLKEERAKAEQENFKKSAEAKRDEFRRKAEVFQKEAPDFEEAIEDSGLAEIPNLGAVLIESDMGPEVAYYLAKNPDEAEKLEGMNYGQLSRHIGRLEAKLEKSEKTEIKTTKAPAPINPVRKSAGSSDSPYDSQMTPEQYKAWRAKQKQR